MLKKIKTPLYLTIFFLIIILLWKILDLPSEAELIEIVKIYFSKYGLITVFLASLIEGMLLVGFYIPGGLVIFLGVILSAGNPWKAMLSVVLTIIGFIIAYTFNYFLGKYGWYKILIKFGMSDSLEEAKLKFEKNGNKAIYFSYWQPNLAALTSTAAGILRAPFNKFFITSALASVLWYSFWGVVAYFLGQRVMDYLGYVFFGFMIIWIGSILIKYRKEKNENI